MRRTIFAALCMATASPAFAGVSVSFVEPAGFTDATSYGQHRGGASPAVLRDLEAHLVKLGERHLAANCVLKIEVLDIDLAGEIEPFRRSLYDVRVLRGVTWPRIKLRYALEEDGRLLRQAEEWLADPAYLLGATRLGDNDRLYYEKRMLDDWFRSRFPRGTPADHWSSSIR